MDAYDGVWCTITWMLRTFVTGQDAFNGEYLEDYTMRDVWEIMDDLYNESELIPEMLQWWKDVKEGRLKIYPSRICEQDLIGRLLENKEERVNE